MSPYLETSRGFASETGIDVPGWVSQGDLPRRHRPLGQLGTTSPAASSSHPVLPARTRSQRHCLVRRRIRSIHCGSQTGLVPLRLERCTRRTWIHSRIEWAERDHLVSLTTHPHTIQHSGTRLAELKIPLVLPPSRSDSFGGHVSFWPRPQPGVYRSNGWRSRSSRSRVRYRICLRAQTAWAGLQSRPHQSPEGKIHSSFEFVALGKIPMMTLRFDGRLKLKSRPTVYTY